MASVAVPKSPGSLNRHDAATPRRIAGGSWVMAGLPGNWPQAPNLARTGGVVARPVRGGAGMEAGAGPRSTDPPGPCSRRRLALWVLPGLAGLPTAARAGDVLDWANRVMEGCWSCGTLNEIVKIGLDLAEKAFNALSAQTANLLGLLMAVWILFFAARFLLPFGPEQAGGGLWNKGARKLFQLAVVLALLQSSQSFWNYVFIPVMSAGMEFSRTVVTLTDPYENARGTAETGPSQPAGGGASPYCQATGTAEGVSGAVAVMNQMNCPLATVQSQFGKGMMIGVAQIWGAVTNVMAGRAVASIVGGLLLIGVFFFGMILYPVFMIDVVMRVTIVTVMAPIALAASMFEPTRRMAEKALWQIAQAALTLVFVSIVTGIGKATLAYVFSHLTVGGNPAGAADWKELIRMLEDQKTGQGKDFYIDLTTMAFYELLGVGVIMLFMLRQAGRMAAEFTGGSGGDFSGALAGTAAIAGVVANAGGRLAEGVVRGGRPSGGGLAAKVAGSSSEPSGQPGGTG